MSRSTSRPVWVAALSSVVTLVGCTASNVVIAVPPPGGDSIGVADSIVVVPQSLQLQVGEAAVLSAAAVDPLGFAVPPGALSWSSADPLVASVTAAGLVTGMSAGSTQVLVQSSSSVATVPVTVAAGPSPPPPAPPADLVVDGSARRYGPLPVITFALADDQNGTDLYPLGSGEETGLFGLFDTGTTRLRLYDRVPYSFQTPGNPNGGLVVGVPHRLTDGNYFASDATLLGMTVEQMVRVRLNGLGAIDPGTRAAPFGLGQAQLEVQAIPARPEPQPLDVSLIGGEVTWSIVALIDYTTRVVRSGYPFYPGLTNPTEAGTGVQGFAPVNAVAGPDITFFSQTDPAIPALGTTLALRRFSTRWELLGVEFRRGGATYTDADPNQPPWTAFDTGTTITIIGDQVAAALGLNAGTGTFPCLSGANNGYVLDEIHVSGTVGSYAVTNANVCWDQSELEPVQAAVIGSNLFDQVPLLFDGPMNELRVGAPTGAPVDWGSGNE